MRSLLTPEHLQKHTMQLALALCAFVSSEATTFAVARDWANILGGSASNPNNWTPAGQFNPGDLAIFVLPANYTVTWGASVPLSAYQRYSGGSVRAEYLSPHVVDVIHVHGITSNVFTIGAGQVTVNDCSVNGDILGGPAVSSRMVVDSGLADLIVTNDLDVSHRASLILSNSASLQCGGDISVGGGGAREVIVDGSSLTQTSPDTSTFQIGGTDSALFELRDGGIASIGRMNVWNSANSTANIRVGVADGMNCSLDTVGINLNSSTVNRTLNFEVGPRGFLHNDGSLTYSTVGFPMNGAVLFGGTVRTGAVLLRDFPLTVYGGMTIIERLPSDTGYLIESNAITVNRIAQGTRPTLRMAAGGSIRSDLILIGDNGRGALELTSGDYNLESTNIVLGRSVGGDGIMTTARPDDFRMVGTSTLVVGDDGNATANIGGDITSGVSSSSVISVGQGLGAGVLNAGGNITVRDINVGTDAALGGSGTMTVAPSTTVMAMRRFNVGSSSVGSGLVEATGAIIGLEGDLTNYQCNILRTGVLRLTDSTFVMPATLSPQGVMRLEGFLDLNNGNVSNTKVAMLTNPNADVPKITGAGVINAEVTTCPDGIITIANGGILELGPRVGTTPFSNSGLMRASQQSTLKVNGQATNAATGNIELQNGTLDASGYTLTNLGVISGNGRFDGTLLNRGNITLTDFSSISGIRFRGPVQQNSGGGMIGTRAWFDASSSFVGSGSISAKVLVAGGSFMEATGALTIGDATQADGVVFEGLLRSRGNVVIINDNNGVSLPSGASIDMSGTGGATDSVRVPSGLTLEQGSSVVGDGTIVAAITNRGLLNPIGSLTLQGAFNHANAGEIRCRTNGPGAGNTDRLAVIGSITIAGGLTMTIAPSYTPSVGDTVTVLTHTGTRTGQFSRISVVGGPSSIDWNAVYAAGAVRLVAVSSGPNCDSIDFNNDSLFPADEDFIDFLNVFAGGPCSPGNTCNDIDFNNDGLFPSDDDLVAFLRVLAGGSCS